MNYCFVHSGIIEGARVSQYLLERSRIVFQAPDERNYHIFYEMLAGLSEEELQNYGLGSVEDYFYLNQVRNSTWVIIYACNMLCVQGKACTIANKDEAQGFNRISSAMEVLGMQVITLV